MKTMITVLTILFIIGIFVILVKNLKKNQKELLDNSNLRTRNRLLKYLLFMVCSLILPFIVTIISIMISGSRESGMEIGFRIPFFVINVGFAFVIIKAENKIKLFSGAIVTIVTLALMLFIMYSNVLESEMFKYFDSYGIWRLIILFNIISLTSWEIIYRILNKNKFTDAK